MSERTLSDWPELLCQYLSYPLFAFLTARGAPPPLALARRLRASLGAQALVSLLAGPHPRPFSLGGYAPRSGRRRLSHCSRGPTPARSRSAATRLARAAGACLTARGAPPPLALARRLRASLGPQAL